MDHNPQLLQLEGIVKAFNGVTVLDHVDLTVNAGEIVSIVGENGAGKSTLMKIVAGAYQPDGGELKLDGQAVRFKGRGESRQAGVRIVFQEFNLLPERTVVDNLFLGREQTRRGRLATADMADQARHALDGIGATNIDPRGLVKHLSVADMQMVEIAKALMGEARVLIMDEPTAALSEPEAERLFERLEAVRDRGIAVLYISHRIPEVFRLSDRIMVLKDGQCVGTWAAEDTTPDQIVEEMVGRPLASYFPERPTTTGATGPADVVLAVRDASNRRLKSISFDLHAGEILGVGGLAGSGRSALVQALFGADPFETGTITIDGVPVKVGNPRAAINAGLCMIPEDRKRDGLILGQGSLANSALALWSLPRRGRQRRLGGRTLHQRATELFERMDLRAADHQMAVRFLSGGNQQKVVLSKWLAMEPRVLLVDEPTRGIDVGAKAGIFALIRDLADQGMGIIMVSSELPELVGVADRILVLADGSLQSILPGESSESEIMKAATAVNANPEVAV